MIVPLFSNRRYLVSCHAAGKSPAALLDNTAGIVQGLHSLILRTQVPFAEM